MISIGDIYDKDVNFLFGSGASFGLLPTLQLQLQNGDGRYTLEELATKFEHDKDRRLIPLFMHYYNECIRPAEQLTIQTATATDKGRKVIDNYRTFLSTVLEMVRKATQTLYSTTARAVSHGVSCRPATSDPSSARLVSLAATRAASLRSI